MVRRVATVVTVALLLAGCQTEAETTTSRPATSSTSAPSTTTSTTTTTVAPIDPVGIEDRLSAGDSRYPDLGNLGYDVDHYTVDLTYDPDANTINALVTIEAHATETIDTVGLDFVGYDVTSVKVDGEEAVFERQHDKLIVTASTPIPASEEFSISVAYNGEPAPVLSQALPFPVGWMIDPNGTAFVAAEPDGARSWLPVNDHPSDKATYTFMITVPDPLVAAANGVHAETITDLGWSTWVWEEPHPMASYLATVVIGRLEIVEEQPQGDVQIRNVLPDDFTNTETLALHSEMIEYLSEVFGPYPFDAYGLAVVDDFPAALENQTLSVFGRTMTGPDIDFEIVMVHELAHQWFGDSVTPIDWGDVWLNEGFATYAEWLWLEHTRGERVAMATISGARNQMARESLPPPGEPPADDLFNASVYVRGGLVLHALRTEVGDDAFFEILRSWADTYAYGVASTEDFITLAESTSDHDLDELFEKWLYGEQVPALP